MLRRLFTNILLLSALFAHAQSMQVHHSDGWTEEIPVNQIDSVTFSDTTTNLAPTVMLNNGMSMSTLGIGTYSLHGDVCFNSVYTALKNGYRLIDTAYMYGNEEEVGRAVRQAVADGICKREDIIVITKLYPGEQFSNPEPAIEMALKKLDIDYIDIMLLHHPGTDDVKAYKAMEKYHAQGKIHALGISCFYIKELTDFLPKVSVMPVLVQNEIHPLVSLKIS